MVIVLRWVLFVFGVAAVLLAAATPRPSDAPADLRRRGERLTREWSAIAALCFAGIIFSALPQ